MNIWEYIDKNKIISAILVIWTYGLLTWVVFKVFADVTLINAAVVSALASAVGIPAVAVGIFKWRREKVDVG